MNNPFRVFNILLGSLIVFLAICFLTSAANAQFDDGLPAFGTAVPNEVESIYQKGLDYLAKRQKGDGGWPTASAFGSDTSAVTAICTMAFMSYGEDPNYGRYAENIRGGLRKIIRSQNGTTGLFRGNSYDFGFAMLCLAEAYGAVDSELLWAGEKQSPKNRTIAESLELAVRAAIIPEKRKGLVHHSWYSTGSIPQEGITDTSVAGSIMMGLLAARNAGVAVPDSTIEKAVAYFEYMTSKDGTVGYIARTGGDYGNSMARSAIVTLVMAIAKRTDSAAYLSCRDYLLDNIEQEYDAHVFYGRYYMAQALFQSDYDAWKRWNKILIEQTSAIRNDDGSLGGSKFGKPYATGMSLLCLALNYRFLPVYER